MRARGRGRDQRQAGGQRAQGGRSPHLPFLLWSGLPSENSKPVRVAECDESSHRRCPTVARSPSSRRRARRRSARRSSRRPTYFESRGYTVVFGPHHRDVHGYLAGTDEHRAADLQWALTEPGIDMVLVLGGRLRRRPAVPADRLGRARRPADRLRLQRHHRDPPRARQARPVDDVLRPDVHALHAQEGRADRRDEGVVPPRLQARAARPRVRGSRRPVRAHRRRRRRRGADRRRLPDARRRSLGTPYEIETDGCILMIEDLNEEPYMIDAGLNHLIRAGKLDNVGGLRVRHRRQPQGEHDPRVRRLEPVDRGDPRRADRAARHPGDRQRAGRPRQAHGHDPARRAGAARRRRQDARHRRGRASRERRRSTATSTPTSSASATSCASRRCRPPTATCARPPTRSAS